MTADQAKAELMRGMEHDARMEAAGMIRRVEEEPPRRPRTRRAG